MQAELEAVTGVDEPFKKSIGEITFEEVHRAFSNFASEVLVLPRGGFRIEGKSSHFPAAQKIVKQGPLLKTYATASADYHVESSFIPEQEYYARIALSCITALARGAVINDPTKQVASLSERIISRFLSTDQPQVFDKTVYKSLIATFSSFSNLFPNLMPAMDNILLRAGYEGVRLAIEASSYLLFEASNGRVTESLRRKKYGGLVKDRFIGLHPSPIPEGDANQEVRYEL